MKEETGVVIKTEGIKATVAVASNSACDGCTAGGACTMSDNGAEIDAINQIQAGVGQTVKIAMKPYTYLKGTILVYGLPLFLFISASIGGKIIGDKYFSQMNTDVISAISGFSFFAISVLIIKIWSGKLEKKVEYQPVIEKILSS